MQTFDCVVVGAGWYGLAAASQYRFVNPNDDLVIFDAQSTVGGTWAEERLYADLKTNNLYGTYEYPGFPMSSDPAMGKQHIPGTTVHEYLKSYVSSVAIDHLIQLNTRVTITEHQSTGGWVLTVVKTTSKEELTVFAQHLIVATGLTSEPQLPSFPGQETFNGEVFHVFGASKFAWDAVYSYITAGVLVNWVVRASGHGPCWMTPPFVTPFKLRVEKLAHTRLFTWLSPCVWGEADGFCWIRRLLHGTRIGRLFVKLFFALLAIEVQHRCGLASNAETAKLKPWIDVRFAGTSFSILNYDVDMIKLLQNSNGMVKVHIGDIERLSPGKVHLTDGTSFEAEALFAHTGWLQNSPVKFLPEGIEAELGIPLSNGQLSRVDRDMINKIDTDIWDEFSILRGQPTFSGYVPMMNGTNGLSQDKPPSLPSFMLHRFMVPPSKQLLPFRDIAFAGLLYNFSNPITAYTQGLWISTYFAGRMRTDPSQAAQSPAFMDKIRYEAALHNRFGHWRHPVDWASKAPAFIFDTVPYLSMLLNDMGLSVRRKRSLLQEIFHAYGPEDFDDLHEEWLAKIGRPVTACSQSEVSVKPGATGFLEE